MSKDLEDIKKKALPILKEAGVTRSSVFGSYARGENNNSDIDLLVDMPKDSSLFDLLRVKIDLEEKLGRRVDLVQYKAIKLRLKDEILSHQESVFI